MQKNIKDWIWLNSLKSLSFIKKVLLIEHFNDPKNIKVATINELKSIKGITRANIEEILDKNQKEYVENLFEDILKRKIEVININDDNYPKLLKNIYDPPILLYKKGDFFDTNKSIAVVGSRNHSNYGRIVTEKLVKELVKNDFTIISGMARGIDTTAHKTAIENGGKTIAVLGCGLDIVYPNENKNLMEEICQSGSIVSEYVLGTKPLPYNFPARNRIISGLSMGVLVVEAGSKSGSLITAELALNEGREVFSVPGNITSKYSLGTNQLIKDGAKMVIDVNDIIEEINNEFTIDKINYINNTILMNGKIDDSNLTNIEMKILSILSLEELHINEICKRINIPIDEISSTLLLLEIKNYVKSLPGMFYILS
ncbi:MAG: DNA-processing protein DprA [Clostridiales bacterium]